MLETPKIIKITSSPQTPKEPCSSPKLVDFGNYWAHGTMHQFLLKLGASKCQRNISGLQSSHGWTSVSPWLVITYLTSTQKVPSRSSDTLSFVSKFKNHTIRHVSLQEFLFSEVTHFALAAAAIRWPSIVVSTPAGLLSLPGQPGHLKPQCMFKKPNQTKITTKKLN